MARFLLVSTGPRLLCFEGVGMNITKFALLALIAFAGYAAAATLPTESSFTYNGQSGETFSLYNFNVTTTGTEGLTETDYRANIDFDFEAKNPDTKVDFKVALTPTGDLLVTAADKSTNNVLVFFDQEITKADGNGDKADGGGDKKVKADGDGDSEKSLNGNIKKSYIITAKFKATFVEVAPIFAEVSKPIENIIADLQNIHVILPKVNLKHFFSVKLTVGDKKMRNVIFNRQLRSEEFKIFDTTDGKSAIMINEAAIELDLESKEKYAFKVDIGVALGDRTLLNEVANIPTQSKTVFIKVR
jgi:hypothetical protein